MIFVIDLHVLPLRIIKFFRHAATAVHCDYQRPSVLRTGTYFFYGVRRNVITGADAVVVKIFFDVFDCGAVAVGLPYLLARAFDVGLY